MQNNQKKPGIRQEPGLVAFDNMRPDHRAGLFFCARSPQRSDSIENMQAI